MIESLITEFGPVIAICAYFVSKDAKTQEQTAKENEQRIQTYMEILDNLRNDSKVREEQLINTLNNLNNTMNKAFSDFSKTLNVTNESMIEVSTQLGNLGTELHREVGFMTQRIGDIEHGIDRVNEKLGLDPIQKTTKTLSVN